MFTSVMAIVGCGMGPKAQLLVQQMPRPHRVYEQTVLVSPRFRASSKNGPAFPMPEEIAARLSG